MRLLPCQKKTLSFYLNSHNQAKSPLQRSKDISGSTFAYSLTSASSAKQLGAGGEGDPHPTFAGSSINNTVCSLQVPQKHRFHPLNIEAK